MEKQVSGAGLALFRTAFGWMCAVSFAYWLASGWYAAHYVKPERFFSFEAFRWLPILPGSGRYLPGILLLLASLGLGLSGIGKALARSAGAGLRREKLARLSGWVYGISFLYLVLLEQSYFNNHYYLLALLGFLFAWVPTGANARAPGSVPFWALAIFRFQFMIVYFFGGVAKLNADWRSGAVAIDVFVPLCSSLSGGAFCDSDTYVEVARTLGFLGMMFDLYVPFLLISRFRNWAIAAAFLFHLTNFLFVDGIGIFPFLGMVSLILFLKPEAIERTLKRRLGQRFQDEGIPSRVPGPAARGFLVAYCAFQLLFPLRALFQEWPPAWTGSGNYFAWRMKSSVKTVVDFELKAFEPGTGRTRMLFPSTDRGLGPYQVQRVSLHAAVLVQYAHCQKERLLAEGWKGAELRAETCIRFNFREPQRLVDPRVDLASAPIRVFGRYDWVLPLKPDDPSAASPEKKILLDCRR